MTWASRDEHLVLAQNADGFYFVRAGSADAQAVTSFLLEQDVRPAPRSADITALLGRNDAALFCAVRNGMIEGLAACVKDDSYYRLVHFVIKAESEGKVASRLIELADRAARDAGAIILDAETTRHSSVHNLLNSHGFMVDWEEGDAAHGRVVTSIHLVKTL